MVQSVQSPSVVFDNVRELSVNAVTLRLRDGRQVTPFIDRSCFIRASGRPYGRLNADQVITSTPLSIRRVATLNSNKAVMRRRASEG